MTSIMIVDDNEQDRYLLESLLHANGYDIALATNGREALNLAYDDPPDLVVSDILMPVLDGFGLCREWMQDEQLKTIPFVFYSATYQEPEDIQFGLKLGARRYIVKPSEPESFLDVVAELIEEYEKGVLPEPQPGLEEEPVYLKVYNERLVKRLQQNSQQLDQANRRLLALFQVSATLNLLQPERELIEQALAHVTRVMGYTRAHYWAYSPEDRKLHHAFCVGLDNTQAAARRRHMTFDVGEPQGLVGLVAERATPLVVDDVTRESRWISVDPTVRSALLVPVIHDDQIYGVASFVSTKAGTFAREDVRNATVIVNTVAIALENVRLYHRQMELTNQLEEKVALRTAELAAALEQAQQVDRLKSQFISDVNHELRTPLTTISFNIQILPNVEGEKQQQVIDTIGREVAHLTEMIEALLDLSRFDLEEDGLIVEPVQLNDLVQTLLDDRTSLAEEKGLRVEYELDPDLPRLLGDPRLLYQAMVNLFANALHYTDTGTISLRTWQEQRGERDGCAFSLSDTGPGINAEEQKHLFERFYRGAAARSKSIPGAGLGLSMCKEIVHRHHGAISVESRPGEGSTFTFWLPLRYSPPEQAVTD